MIISILVIVLLVSIIRWVNSQRKANEIASKLLVQAKIKTENKVEGLKRKFFRR